MGEGKEETQQNQFQTGYMTYKVGWTLRVSGSFNLTAEGLIILTIGNGPIYLEDSFLDSVLRGRSLVDNQTLSPTA